MYIACSTLQSSRIDICYLKFSFLNRSLLAIIKMRGTEKYVKLVSKTKEYINCVIFVVVICVYTGGDSWSTKKADLK